MLQQIAEILDRVHGLAEMPLQILLAVAILYLIWLHHYRTRR